MLSVIVTRVVFKVARMANRVVTLVGKLSPILVVATVLTSKKKHVGLSLEIVAIVLSRRLLLSYSVKLMVDNSLRVRRCRLVLILVAVHKLSMFRCSSVGAPGT